MKLGKSSLLAVPALAVAATLAWVHPAASQDTAPPHGAAGLSLDQFVARQTARIMAADTDGDGRISRAELVAADKSGGNSSRRFDMMDTNGDGYIDKAEIRVALEKRFRRMDLNGDGILTPGERMTARARREQPRPAGMSAASPEQ